MFTRLGDGTDRMINAGKSRYVVLILLLESHTTKYFSQSLQSCANGCVYAMNSRSNQFRQYYSTIEGKIKLVIFSPRGSVLLWTIGHHTNYWMLLVQAICCKDFVLLQWILWNTVILCILIFSNLVVLIRTQRNK